MDRHQPGNRRHDRYDLERRGLRLGLVQPLLAGIAGDLRPPRAARSRPVVLDHRAGPHPDLVVGDLLPVRHHQSRNHRPDHQPTDLRRLREQLRQRQLDTGDRDDQPVAGRPRGHASRGPIGAGDRPDGHNHLDDGQRRYRHDQRRLVVRRRVDVDHDRRQARAGPTSTWEATIGRTRSHLGSRTPPRPP